ncbi:MAG: hypothetical protein SOX71_09770 [Candidatus Faecousia sp.]|nr:hypothetical protein [Candidatus Faecousia sp.]
MLTGKCAYCGMPLQSGEKFCHSCGAANEFYKPEDEDQFNQRYKLAKEQTKAVKWIMIGMVVFCIVLCATVFGIFWMVS